MPSRTLFAIAMMVFLSSTACAESALTVGVLETPQCLEPAQTGVRPLFVKTPTGWDVVSEASSELLSKGSEWTIALDGKSLGRITTRGMLGDTPVLATAADQKIPPVGNTQQRFDGWCSTPERRPLAAASQDAFADPDQWKPHRPEARQVTALLAQFQAQVGTSVTLCEGEQTRPWTYGATDLQAVAGFQDRQGRRIIGISLNPTQNACDGPPDAAWQPHWFVLGDTPRFIGSNLDLVEAVDFDGDGASELLLWRADYNQDGYLLLDSTLGSEVLKQWSYH